MNERLHWMFPSFYLGRIASTEIRVSFWFVLVPLILCFRLDWQVGLVCSVALFLSVLLHETAHLLVAQLTGGFADELHLTPMGGVVHFKPGQGAIGAAGTALAGPALNLLICVLAFPGWYLRGTGWSALDPFVMPVTSFTSEGWYVEACQILFLANWVLLLINLLPAMPFDGGQILKSILASRVHPELLHRTTSQIGLYVATLLIVGGLGFLNAQLVLAGAVLLAVNAVEFSHEDLGDVMEDANYGYDFSSAFEGLDNANVNANPTADHHSAPGLLQRWRERRRLRRQQQERIRLMDAERQLDALLAKVHESGLQSLSNREQDLLRSCSEILRTRQKIDD